jgi:hypothetical protein
VTPNTLVPVTGPSSVTIVDPTGASAIPVFMPLRSALSMSGSGRTLDICARAAITFQKKITPISVTEKHTVCPAIFLSSPSLFLSRMLVALPRHR